MKYYVSVFKNTKKTTSKHPDLNVILSDADDPQNEDKKIKFGLWQKEAKSGLKYYQGNVELDVGQDVPAPDFDDDIPF